MTPSEATSLGTEPQRRYTAGRREHWERVAASLASWRGVGGTYHRRLRAVYRYLVAPGQRVLELGCGQGDLLAACDPEPGIGVDFSLRMARWARGRHPGLRIVVADAHALPFRASFDVVILSDLLNDVWDVQGVLASLGRVVSGSTRLVFNFYSRVWELPLAVAERLGLAKPVLHQNWLTTEDVANLLHLEGYEVVRRWSEFLCPFSIPVLEPLFNRYFVKLWPFRIFAMTNFILAAPLRPPDPESSRPSVSVVVPARNEAGNIRPLLDRLPRLADKVEVVFVEGHSRDETYAVIEEELRGRRSLNAGLIRQEGEGKGDAVRGGFAAAQGDILVILDADLSVQPEDLPRFVEALASGRAEFANGVRLVYPMEGRAMRLLNLAGNKAFSAVFSWLLGGPVKDTLCGTKALWRRDYLRIAAGRSYFGEFDPFGDFDLLFGAAKLGLRIVDIPVRYHRRVYGETNIDRWRHGWLLMRMAAFGALRVKFV